MMKKEKVKVYIYTRVSTAMQIDGYSLDAQKSRMKAYAEFNDYEIVGEYEDAGKSGKSIEGRIEFNRMMEDIKSGKDGVSYVLVFKLSRFGRNAADVLSTLQVMQDFGVNLICVEDGIDSSKDAGKLMISVLSAVAEIERENIRVQTMEGRIQKAREGRWNGGFAPYGYRLVDGVLQINEDEAPAIRTIFEQYVNTDTGANGLSKYLETHGFQKLARQNGTSPLFSATLIRAILKNPVYCGKIAFGRRKLEKIHGTQNEYHQVPQENYLLVDGLHEGIVSEELWNAAQVKLLAQSKRYEPVNRSKTEQAHLLSALVKCPVCGAGMYSNKCTKRKKDGTPYKSFSYYSCKHRKMQRGQKCDFNKQIQEEVLDNAVVEVIIKLVSNPKFAAMMQEKINRTACTRASYRKNCGTPHRSSCWRSPNDTNQSTAARRNRRIYYLPLSSAPFAVLECTATNAPSERKMAHPINLSLITVASTARCNVGKNAISTSKFRKKFWTTPWWRLSSNWSAIQSLPP